MKKTDYIAELKIMKTKTADKERRERWRGVNKAQNKLELSKYVDTLRSFCTKEILNMPYISDAHKNE